MARRPLCTGRGACRRHRREVAVRGRTATAPPEQALVRRPRPGPTEGAATVSAAPTGHCAPVTSQTFGEPSGHTHLTKEQGGDALSKARPWAARAPTPHGPQPARQAAGTRLHRQGPRPGSQLCGVPARARARGKLPGDTDAPSLHLPRLCGVRFRPVDLFVNCTQGSHLATRRPTPPGTRHAGSWRCRGLGAGVRCSRPPPPTGPHAPGEA